MSNQPADRVGSLWLVFPKCSDLDGLGLPESWLRSSAIVDDNLLIFIHTKGQSKLRKNAALALQTKCGEFRPMAVKFPTNAAKSRQLRKLLSRMQDVSDDESSEEINLFDNSDDDDDDQSTVTSEPTSVWL